MSFVWPRLRIHVSIVLVGSWACLATSAIAAPPAESAPTEQSSAASDAYRAGADAFSAEKYADALALFQKSYGLVASPNSHLMIGRALVKLGKNTEAYRELDATVREAEDAAAKNDKYKKTAETARAELAELRSKVAFVVVDLDVRVTMGGQPVAASDFGKPLVVEPGKMDVVLKLPDGTESHHEIDATPGASTPVTLSPPASSAPTTIAAACPPPPPAATTKGIDQRVLAAVAGGVGVVGVATFAVFGVLDQNEYSDLKKRCAGNVCSTADSSNVETGRTYQTVANVGLGVGILGIASGLVLFLTAPHASPAQRASAATTELAISPRAVTLRGSF